MIIIEQSKKDKVDTGRGVEVSKVGSKKDKSRIKLGIRSKSHNKEDVIDKGDKSNSNKKVGDLGESIAVVFLEKRGFQIVDRNYRNKIGEIDIIAQKDGYYYIVEVKTLRIPSNQDSGGDDLFGPSISVIRDGKGVEWLKPEINLTKEKLRKVRLMALKYCMDFDIKEESLKFLGICISLHHSGSRVTKTNLVSCKVKVLPLFN
ncbi:MAG: YraN family protein [bacterium]